MKGLGTHYRATTLSPGLTDVTSGPTDSTTPAPSCPKTIGKLPSGSLPDRVYASVVRESDTGPRFSSAMEELTGVADTSVVNLDANFVGLWYAYFNVLDGKIFACLPSDRGFAINWLLRKRD